MLNKNEKLCPYRKRSLIYHNKTDNLNLPDYGLNKICDHDIIDVKFQKCIKEKCMMYNEKKQICKIYNNNIQ